MKCALLALLLSSIAVPALAEPTINTAPESEPANRFGFFAIQVQDLEKSLAFYQAGLGLVVMFRDDTPKQLRANIDFPDSKVGAHLLLLQDRVKRPIIQKDGVLDRFAFFVKDIQAMHQRLVAAGATVTSAPRQHPYVKVMIAFYKDPDGNNLELMQPLPN